MMHSKVFLTAFLMFIFSLTACGQIDNAAEPNDEPLDPTREQRQQQTPADQELENELGYVRYTKDQVDNDRERNRTMEIDRNEMANMITRNILRNDGFEEVATLVTDEEVLIAYQKDESKDEDSAADIAKKTAMSIMPAFFEIYVSDNHLLIEDIHSLHNSSTTPNHDYDNTIDRIINEMEKSPQEDN